MIGFWRIRLEKRAFEGVGFNEVGSAAGVCLPFSVVFGFFCDDYFSGCYDSARVCNS